MIVSFVSNGAGVGKTMLASNAAGWFSRTRRVRLVDASEDQKCVRWAAYRERSPFDVCCWRNDQEKPDVLLRDAEFDLTIIDGPSVDRDRKTSVLRSSDVVVFILDTGRDNIGEAVLLLRAAAREASRTGYARIAFLASRTINGSRSGERVRQAALRLGFPMLLSELHIRPLYASAHAAGQTIFAHSGESEAAVEVARALIEIESMLIPQYRSLASLS